jgi:hypothetical protein
MAAIGKIRDAPRHPYNEVTVPCRNADQCGEHGPHSAHITHGPPLRERGPLENIDELAHPYGAVP